MPEDPEKKSLWTKPTIRPLPRLSEVTTPTTISASSPARNRIAEDALMEELTMLCEGADEI
ncbi:MAG: hypothetical protein WC805_00305 [Patescibacteria group bacterium]|jgi:hypothetical protein